MRIFFSVTAFVGVWLCLWSFRPISSDTIQEVAATYDSCLDKPDNIEYWIRQQNYQKAYDTLRYYVDHCYAQANAIRTWGNDFSAVRVPSTRTPEGQIELRNWIYHAISLRSDDPWYCHAVDGLAQIFNERDDRAHLAVFKFLIDNPRCSNDSSFNRAYYLTRKDQIRSWQDSAKDNNMIYFDSSLPSMHELGLDSLLHLASIARYSETASTILGAASLSPNPVNVRSTLTLDVEREAYIHVEVFDQLGVKLTTGFDGVCEPGERKLELDLHDQPPGSYYLRISTANNEVRTMKLVKE